MNKEYKGIWPVVPTPFLNDGVFSSNCGTSSVEDHQSKRKLIKILDVFGRSVTPKPNIPLMYIYDDGSVEKRIMLD